MKSNRQAKARKRRKAFEKKRNIKRCQRKALKKAERAAEGYLKQLRQFLETEDPFTLWNKAERESLASHLAESLKDPRDAQGRRHELGNILLMALYAILCGNATYKAIAFWLRQREGAFTVMLGLAHGTPSAATIGRVMKALSFEKLHAAFHEWARSHIEAFRLLGEEEMELHLCADGKAIRALTKKHEGKKRPPYILNAYLYSPRLGAGFCIASIPIGSKKSEAKRLAPFLAQFAPKGSVVTIDAAGAYRETLKAVLAAGAQALICIKGNQKLLEKDIKESLSQAELRFSEALIGIEGFFKETGFRQKCPTFFSSCQEGPEIAHGRLESRCYGFTTSLNRSIREKWPEIKGAGYAKRSRQLGTKGKGGFKAFQASEETVHYYISTADLGAKAFARLARSHWHIESRLHGILDGPAFQEDRSRMRAGNAYKNMAALRRMAYNLLELLYLEKPPERRPSFQLRAMAASQSPLAIEGILFKKKACLPQIHENI